MNNLREIKDSIAVIKQDHDVIDTSKIKIQRIIKHFLKF